MSAQVKEILIRVSAETNPLKTLNAELKAQELNLQKLIASGKQNTEEFKKLSNVYQSTLQGTRLLKTETDNLKNAEKNLLKEIEKKGQALNKAGGQEYKNSLKAQNDEIQKQIANINRLAVAQKNLEMSVNKSAADRLRFAANQNTAYNNSIVNAPVTHLKGDVGSQAYISQVNAVKKTLGPLSADYKVLDDITKKHSLSLKQNQLELGNTNRSLISNIGALGLYSIGITGVITSVYQLGKTSLIAFAEQEEALHRLKFALNGNDTAYNNLVTKAGQLQATTIYSDEAIEKAQSFLVLQGRSEEQINKTIQAAIDLSAVTGEDLVQSVQKLDGTQEGVIGKMGKLEKSLKDLTPAELEQGKAIDILGAKFKGMGELVGNTTTGQFQKAKNSIGEFFEGLGGGLIENFVSSLSSLNGKTLQTNEVMSRLGKGIGNMIIDLFRFGSLIGQLITLKSNLTKAVEALGNVFSATGKAAIGFLSDLKTMSNGIPGVSSVLDILINKFGMLENAAETAGRQIVLSTQMMNNNLSNLFNQYRGQFSSLTDAENYLKNTYNLTEDQIEAYKKTGMDLGLFRFAKEKEADSSTLNNTSSPTGSKSQQQQSDIDYFNTAINKLKDTIRLEEVRLEVETILLSTKEKVTAEEVEALRISDKYYKSKLEELELIKDLVNSGKTEADILKNKITYLENELELRQKIKEAGTTGKAEENRGAPTTPQEGSNQPKSSKPEAEEDPEEEARQRAREQAEKTLSAFSGMFSFSQSILNNFGLANSEVAKIVQMLSNVFSIAQQGINLFGLFGSLFATVATGGAAAPTIPFFASQGLGSGGGVNSGINNSMSGSQRSAVNNTYIEIVNPVTFQKAFDVTTRTNNLRGGIDL